MAKSIAPLEFYSDQFNKSWAALYKEIMADVKELDATNDEDTPHLKVMVTYLDSLAQLLDELVYAQKKSSKKKTKKSKK